MNSHLTPTGAPVLSCDLDDHCVKVDCSSLLPELLESLADNPEAPDYVAHFCGLDYLAKRPTPAVTQDESDDPD